MNPGVSVCIATYRRNERLRALLTDLAHQERLPEQIVVVDNDASGGARGVIEEFRQLGRGVRIDYDVQPQPSIPLTRNRTVELAECEWLAFIDDDERAPPQWLRGLVDAADRFQADGVLAPVEPRVPQNAPAWLRRGRFYDWPHAATGSRVPQSMLRFGNVLLRGSIVRAEPGAFDAEFGLKAGEDLDLLIRLSEKGALIVWSEESPVFEPIEAQRLRLGWLLRREFGGGQGYARAITGARYRPIDSWGCARFYLRAAMQLLVAAVLAVLTLPLGRHRSAHWLIKVSGNWGKLSTLWGGQYLEYARTGAPRSGQS